MLFCFYKHHKGKMQFTDLIFLLVFLPMALLLFHIGNDTTRQYVLLLANLVFYTLGSPDFFLNLCICTIVNTVIGVTIEGIRDRSAITRKILLTVGVIFNLVILFECKYMDNSLLPLGISFYTFKAISFLVDVYKGEISGKSVISIANYLTFFGQIQSGPISRYGEFSKERTERRELFCYGVERFVIGFSKKVLLANVLVKVTNEVFSYENPSLPFAWLGSMCYSLQLYYDFSGYSDMAIGISGMFGISCLENFNYPYATASISDFWRRWHISLGQWFRDYVYIPLGGSRVKLPRVIFNLGVVWILTGIWHGNTFGFVFWGLAYFILVAFEKLTGWPQRFKHKWLKIAYRVYSLLMINFLWVIFYYGDLAEGVKYIRRMIVPSGYDISVNRAYFLFIDYKLFILAALIFATPAVSYIKGLCENNKSTEIAFNIVYGVIVSSLFVISLAMVVSGISNPFLYIGF